MHKKSLLYIVLAGIMWGTSGIFFNLLEPYGFSPIQMTAMRGVVAAISMSTYMLISDRSLFKVSKRDIPLVIGGGLSMFLTAYFYYFAIQESSVSTAVILMYTAPIFVMAFSVAFFRGEIKHNKSLIRFVYDNRLCAGFRGCRRSKV